MHLLCMECFQSTIRWSEIAQLIRHILAKPWLSGSLKGIILILSSLINTKELTLEAALTSITQVVWWSCNLPLNSLEAFCGGKNEAKLTLIEFHQRPVKPIPQTRL